MQLLLYWCRKRDNKGNVYAGRLKSKNTVRHATSNVHTLGSVYHRSLLEVGQAIKLRVAGRASATVDSRVVQWGSLKAYFIHSGASRRALLALSGVQYVPTKTKTGTVYTSYTSEVLVGLYIDSIAGSMVDAVHVPYFKVGQQPPATTSSKIGGGGTGGAGGRQRFARSHQRQVAAEDGV